MKNLRTAFLALAAITTVLAMFSFRPDKKTIVIDAGHGGQDRGASIESIHEKDIVNSIAKKISALSAGSNIEIVLLRDGDHFVDLKDRVAKANEYNPDLLVSLHVDQDLSSANSGVRAFINQNDYHQSSVRFADRLLTEVSKNGLKKGTVQTASFFVIKNAKCPSVNLLLGNLTNASDRKYITSEKGQEEIARNILAGVK